MKSFLKDLKGFGQKAEAKGILIGKIIKVGPYTIKPEAVLGQGGFATIYKVRDSTSGAIYALKHMHLMGDKDAIADCQTEVETLKRLREVPSVLTLRALAFAGAKGQEQEAFLLLDMCQDNLVEYLTKQTSQLPDNQVITIFHAVCQAVAAMHHCDPPLAHRDLKAENVLLHQQGHWVLCDFGSTTSFAGVYESTNAIMAAEEIIRKYTTPAYRAPEMYDLYMRERIDTKADIWALGCLLFYLAYGKLAFVGEAKLQVLNGDFSIPPRPQRPQSLKDLIRLMLTVQPAQRPDIEVVMAHLSELATNLKVDPAPASAATLPSASVTRAAAPNAAPQASAGVQQGSQQGPQQGVQPVSTNPHDLVSTPVSAPGRVLPARSASSDSLKAGNQGSQGPSRSSSPASGMAPLSPQHPRTAGTGASRGTPPAGPSAPGDRSQQRSQQQADTLSNLTAQPAASPAASSDVGELRQTIAGLQLQNSQLLYLTKQQQATIADLERELRQLKAASRSNGSQQQQPKLVSLDSWSQQSGDIAAWDAFSDPTAQSEPARQPRVSGSAQLSPLSPLSPQRQAASAQAFIKSQTSNMQSMQDMLPAFDPFGISNEPNEQSKSALGIVEAAQGDEEDEPSTPLSGAIKTQQKHKLGGRHRRTTSEPTPMDSWQLRSEWPQQ